MKATMIIPIESIQGKITKGYYARILNGKTIIQRCPIRNNKPTSSQIAARENFIKKFAPKKHPPP